MSERRQERGTHDKEAFFDTISDIEARLLDGNRFGPGIRVRLVKDTRVKVINAQVPREVNITSILHSQMVREDLQGDDIQQSLQAIDGFRDADRLAVGRNSGISLTAQDDRLRFPGSDLSISGLYFRIKRILSHDNYDGHVFIDQGERAMLEFPSKDTYQDNSGKKR